MEITAYHPFIQALQESFGSKPWTPGELKKKKGKVKNALAVLLKKTAKEVRAGDYNKLIYDLWEARVLELVPPKPTERSYRIRLISDAATNLPTDEAIERAYHALKSETRMVNVYFNDLVRRSGQPLASVHAWALARAQKGEAELSEGDFSRASGDQRKACFIHNEKKFLLVGIFS